MLGFCDSMTNIPGIAYNKIVERKTALQTAITALLYRYKLTSLQHCIHGSSFVVSFAVRLLD